jgi:feruloyl esterase
VDEVQTFYRLLPVAGTGHGNDNGTANSDANPPGPAHGQMYRALTNWVEKGIAPDTLVLSSRPSAAVPKSLPACFYPKRPTYQAGDPFKAASYRCL